jgi:hypothetical protein
MPEVEFHILDFEIITRLLLSQHVFKQIKEVFISSIMTYFKVIFIFLSFLYKMNTCILYI